MTDFVSGPSPCPHSPVGASLFGVTASNCAFTGELPAYYHLESEKLLLSELTDWNDHWILRNRVFDDPGQNVESRRKICRVNNLGGVSLGDDLSFL